MPKPPITHPRMPNLAADPDGTNVQTWKIVIPNEPHQVLSRFDGPAMYNRWMGSAVHVWFDRGVKKREVYMSFYGIPHMEEHAKTT